MRRKKKNVGDISIKPKKSRKKKIVISSIIIILLIAVGVSVWWFTQDQPQGDKKEPVEEPKKPLTIVDENSNQRPIAVMIDNNVGTTSHAGLQDAYITYEAIVEGGLTRIMAVFKDRTTSLIGPVRSSRHYFLDYALENDALYAHYGWSTYAQNDISALHVNNINGLYVSGPYWRDSSIAAPHNVFTSIEKLYASAVDLGYETTSSQWQNLNYTTDTVDLTTFEDSTITCEENEEACNKNPNLITANKVTIPYSYSQERSYQYDSTTDTYLRFMNGRAHTDKTTGQQYNYKNVIIMKVNNFSLDNEGRQDLDTTGSGDGYYLTGGYALPITWHKASRTSKTAYTYSDGSEVKIKDGNTFIQIEPINQIPSFE